MRKIEVHMKTILTLMAMCGVMFAAAAAEESGAAPAPATREAVEAVQINLNVVWTLIAGILDLRLLPSRIVRKSIYYLSQAVCGLKNFLMPSLTNIMV